jgi:hypothetical protein
LETELSAVGAGQGRERRRWIDRICLGHNWAN